MTETDHLNDLTPSQREAVEHRDGPALVVAGAGSGKTRVITRRIVHLLRSGVASDRILALTFTNKAAGEMRDRVQAMVPESKVWLGTFHSFAARVLRRNCQKLNLDKDFHICDDDDRKKLVRECMELLGLPVTRETVGEALDVIGEAKNTLVSPGEYPLTAPRHRWVYGQLYQTYQWTLRRRNHLDFDDLINLLCTSLLQDESLRAELDDRFRYVLVDETQDTNSPQYLLIRLLTRDTSNVMIVGDPDQSIYAFRNADIKNILGFVNDYQNCKVVKLEENYRSTPEILRAADSLIRRNHGRIEKTLVPTRAGGRPVQLVQHGTPEAEAKWVAEQIQRAIELGGQYADHAILLRINRLVWEFENALLRRQIPYKIHGGGGFLSRAEVKDVLAYCRLAVCPSDPAAFVRVVNTPNRGVGKVTLERLLAWATDHAAIPLDACRRAGVVEGVSRKSVAPLEGFAALVDRMGTLRDQPADLFAVAAVDSGYRQSLLDEETAEANERVENIDRLCALARNWAENNPDGGTAECLESLALGEQDEVDEDEEAPDRVAIMTIHAAKGLEFPTVYLPGLENGVLPGTQTLSSGRVEDIEEERRTLFVGMTRAMDRLVLSTCLYRRDKDDQMRLSPPSMFLDELPLGEIERVVNRPDKSR